MKRADITAIFPDATEEQVNRLMGINGADINSARQGLEDLRTQLQEANRRPTPEDLQRESARAAALETELNSLKQSNQIRDIRAAVSKEKGVPEELLTGDTEDACKAQADGILAFAKPSGYPKLHDGGEAGLAGAKGSTREIFADWAKDKV